MKIEKRNGIRKGILAAVCLGLALLTGACAAGENKVPVIGIAQYGEHGSLDNCREGFLQGLAKAGLQEGKDYTLDVQNASFDDAVNNQIAQKFSDENAALMVGIATPSAQACFNAAEEKDIPVIFTAVTDPVGAKLDQGNVTGTSDVLPVEGQLKLIRKLQPEARTVGILYTTSEANSLYALAQYRQLAGDYGFTIDAVAVTAHNVVGVLPAILEKTDAAGIPVYGSEIEQVKLGCVAGAGLDYVKLGIQTGEMAARVLRGEASCRDIPYASIADYDLYINTKALTALGMKVPEDLTEAAVECGE